jgi:hypothetical protein
MRNPFALLALAVAAVALAIYLERPGNQLPETVRNQEPASTPVLDKEIDKETPAIAPASTEQSEPETKPFAPEPPLAPPLALEQGTLPWEEKIERVLRDGGLSNTAKARRLVALFPELPADGLATAAEECIERLPDADYNVVALPVIANPQTHGAVANLFFADLMERPDAITLPALFRIAQIPNHPYAKSARENLRLLLDEDFGSDWPKWDAAIRAALTHKVE